LLPPLLYLARFVRNPLSAAPRQVYEEPIVTYTNAGDRIAWVMAPPLIETILLREWERFPKTPLDKRVLGPALGDGILTSEGPQWRWQRKTAAPLFRHTELLDYVPVMADSARDQLERWRLLPPGATTEIEADMTATTFAVVSRTVLAGCDASEGAIIQRAGRQFLDPISWPIGYAVIGFPAWLWHPGKRRMLRAAAEQRAAVGRLVARRQTEEQPTTDLLSRLLAARHPDTNEPMSPSQLVDNVTTFLAAGHETTAKALTWALYLLARAPEWQERVRAEAQSVSDSRAIAAGDIERLSVTQLVLKEAMRLYPPAPVLTRHVSEDVELGGKRLSKGSLLIIPIYAIHRHRRYWDDPDRFDPERFRPEREAQYARTQFMPFGFGPRTCIGQAFAMIEAATLLATLVKGARFEWDGRHEPEPVSRVTLRPKGGMPLRVTLLA
jgi:cytochrome P450